MSELRSARMASLVAISSVPILIVCGAHDLLSPARVVRRLDRPGGAVVLPRCGHCPQIERPQALLAEVLPFLRQVRAAHPNPMELARPC
jgi:pimeloyl-ACP methyl ester carboxylesterase